ncbi:GGDEF domain-containing protein [Derxia gummosa]|uniref:GGDEF domain-containing protein n=1 Tax=Derxia gummosa DSM 723 TaxID=1121388 RepID=A0A8B6X948_9BURK|nr:GGDEF domain-containing protein [Derxia gummosa]
MTRLRRLPLAAWLALNALVTVVLTVAAITLVIEHSTDDAGLLLRMRWTAGLVLAAALPLSIGFGHLFARPLRRIVRALGEEMPPPGVTDGVHYREAGQLARAVHGLLDQLRGHRQALDAVTASLEQRVALRTRELSEANARLGDTQKRLTEITENVPALITYVDRDYRNQYANATLKAWTGIDPAQAVGKPLIELMGAAKFALRKPAMDRALAGERVRFTEEWRTGDELRHIDVVYVPHRDASGEVIGMYGLSTDMTAIHRAEAMLQRLARRDALTDLHNRLALGEMLPEALARARASLADVALLFIDVDRFKRVNDTLGHAAGDEVLRQFAQRLLGCVRTTDTVARLAGDEFVIVLENLPHADDAEVVARKIVAAMAEPMLVQGHELTAGASIGIAHAPAGKGTPEELLAQADRALYEVKRNGRGLWRMAPLPASAPAPAIGIEHLSDDIAGLAAAAI